MEQHTPPPGPGHLFRDLSEAITGPVRESVENMARAFAGWPTDHQAPEDPEAFHARPPVQVIARRRAANKRARATRQAQRRG